DGEDDVAGLEACLLGRAARRDRGLVVAGRVRRRLDQRAVVDAEALVLLDLEVDLDVADADVRAGQLLTGERLLHDRAGDVDGDGEADARRVALDRGVD